jgi:hypothetical protein
LGAAGLGSLFGQLGSAAITKKLRKGGIIRDYRAFGLDDLASVKRKDPAEGDGGVISGPGTASSDSILATIEGLQPVRLSNGEAVLNAEAVELLGEDFVHRINSAGLSGLKPRAVEEMRKEKNHV